MLISRSYITIPQAYAMRYPYPTPPGNRRQDLFRKRSSWLCSRDQWNPGGLASRSSNRCHLVRDARGQLSLRSTRKGPADLDVSEGRRWRIRTNQLGAKSGGFAHNEPKSPWGHGNRARKGGFWVWGYDFEAICALPRGVLKEL